MSLIYLSVLILLFFRIQIYNECFVSPQINCFVQGCVALVHFSVVAAPRLVARPRTVSQWRVWRWKCPCAAVWVRPAKQTASPVSSPQISSERTSEEKVGYKTYSGAAQKHRVHLAILWQQLISGTCLSGVVWCVRGTKRRRQLDAVWFCCSGDVMPCKVQRGVGWHHRGLPSTQGLCGAVSAERELVWQFILIPLPQSHPCCCVLIGPDAAATRAAPLCRAMSPQRLTTRSPCHSFNYNRFLDGSSRSCRSVRGKWRNIKVLISAGIWAVALWRCYVVFKTVYQK